MTQRARGGFCIFKTSFLREPLQPRREDLKFLNAYTGDKHYYYINE